MEVAYKSCIRCVITNCGHDFNVGGECLDCKQEPLASVQKRYGEYPPADWHEYEKYTKAHTCGEKY